MKFTLIILGAAMIGFQIPEAFAAFGKIRVPMIMNIWWGAAFAMVAAGIVLP